MEEYRFSFPAIDDNGNTHTIRVSVDVIKAGTLSDPNHKMDGLQSLRTDNGLAVNYTSKGKYLIVQTNTNIYSDHPDAL